MKSCVKLADDTKLEKTVTRLRSRAAQRDLQSLEKWATGA